MGPEAGGGLVRGQLGSDLPAGGSLFCWDLPRSALCCTERTGLGWGDGRAKIWGRWVAQAQLGQEGRGTGWGWAQQTKGGAKWDRCRGPRVGWGAPWGL